MSQPDKEMTSCIFLELPSNHHSRLYESGVHWQMLRMASEKISTMLHRSCTPRDFKIIATSDDVWGFFDGTEETLEESFVGKKTYGQI